MPGINWNQVNTQKPTPQQNSAPGSNTPQPSNQKPEDFLGNVFSKAKMVFDNVMAPPIGLNVPPMAAKMAKAIADNPKKAILGAADQLPLIGAVVPPLVVDALTEGFGIPAHVAISALGAGTGKFLDEVVHGIFDRHQNILSSSKSVVTDPKKLLGIAGSGVLAGATQGVAEAVLPLIMTKFLSAFSGISEPLVKAAWTDAGEPIVGGFKGGYAALQDLVRTVAPKLQEAQVAGEQYYGEQLQAIKDIPAKGGEEALSGLMKNVETVLKNGKVAVQDGSLNFSRVIHFSSGDMSQVVKAFGLIEKVVGQVGETTAENLDSTIQSMGGLRSFEGQPVGNDAKSIIGQMYHELNQFIQEFHPHLAEIRNESIPSMEFFREMGNIIPHPNSLDNAAVKASAEKLLNIFNPENAATTLRTVEGGGKVMVQDILKEVPGLEKFIGQDILPNIQGTALKISQDTSPIGSISRMRIVGKALRGISSNLIKAPLQIAGINTTIQKVVDGLLQAGVPQKALNGIAQYLVSHYFSGSGKSSAPSKPSLPNTPPLKVNEGSKPTSRKSGGRMIAKADPAMVDKGVLQSDISGQKTPPGKTVIGTSDLDGNMQYVAAEVDKEGQIVKAGLNLG